MNQWNNDEAEVHISQTENLVSYFTFEKLQKLRFLEKKFFVH